jgi:hypothetical protein
MKLRYLCSNMRSGETFESLFSSIFDFHHAGARFLRSNTGPLWDSAYPAAILFLEMVLESNQPRHMDHHVPSQGTTS